jgi:hypothetical protein
MDTQEYVSPSVDLEPEDEKSPFDRFAEVFTAPADAFAGLAQAKRGPIILWGLLIMVVASMFAAVIFSTNDEMRETAKDKQIEQFDKMRDEGKISEEQYEQQVEMMDTMMSGTMFMIWGLLGASIGSTLFALLIGLIVFILIKVLGRDGEAGTGYAAALAATLIAFMITNVESIITVVGMMLTGNMEFRLSPVIFGAPDNEWIKFFLNLINPFTIWFWFALGTGVAVLSRAERTKSIIAVAAVWIIGGLIITGIGSIFGSMSFGS